MVFRFNKRFLINRNGRFVIPAGNLTELLKNKALSVLHLSASTLHLIPQMPGGMTRVGDF